VYVIVKIWVKVNNFVHILWLMVGRVIAQIDQERYNAIIWMNKKWTYVEIVKLKNKKENVAMEKYLAKVKNHKSKNAWHGESIFSLVMSYSIAYLKFK